ncbi:MAG: M1 family aminopeptidase [Gemmatimonadales bacterium]
MRSSLLLATVLALPATAAAQAGHVIGEYHEPRTWNAPPHGFDLLHQRIAVSFDMGRRLVSGEVTTTVVIRDQPAGSVRLDAGNLTIDAAADAQGRRLPFTFDTSSVTVRLPRRAAVGDTVVFSLRYHTVPERGIYFVPRRGVIWSQGEATETRNWVPTYDRSNDKTTWEFLVTADTGFKVLSNGRLVDTTRTADGRAMVWHWSQGEPASTYLYSVVVAPFTVLRDQWRGKPVDYWVAPDTVLAAWRSFGETPSMIEIYSRVLGVPYPWDKYDQAIIPDFTYGGMENVSATTQTDLALHTVSAEPEFSTRGLNAHELAHQWFGDYTTTANWANIWLNEGLTTYMESVQEEKSRGWEAAQWNWFNQQQAAMNADRNQERPLVWGEYQGDDPIVLFFSGHVYPKGAQVAHQLRRLLGDSLFWAGMHRFLVDNAHKPVTTADYAIAMEKVSGRDLDWFFDQWAYGIGYPKLNVTRRWDPASGTLTVDVEQTQTVDSLHPVFRFPVTVRVITADSVVRQEIMITQVKQSFRVRLPGPPLSFRFDEGGWLLGTVSTDQTPAELAAMAAHDLDFSARNWALRRLRGSTDTAAVSARRLIALNEHEPHLRAEAVTQLGGDSSAVSVAVVRAATGDPDSRVRAPALASLAKYDSTMAEDLAARLYRTDPSLVVRINALNLWARTGSAESQDAVLAAAGSDNPNPLRQQAAAMLGASKDPRAADVLAGLTGAVENRGLRTTALNSLARAFPDRAAQVATRGLADEDPLYAVAAANTLGRVGGEAGKAALRQALTNETRVTVKAAIQRALRRK